MEAAPARHRPPEPGRAADRGEADDQQERTDRGQGQEREQHDVDRLEVLDLGCIVERLHGAPRRPGEGERAWSRVQLVDRQVGQLAGRGGRRAQVGRGLRLVERRMHVHGRGQDEQHRRHDDEGRADGHPDRGRAAGKRGGQDGGGHAPILARLARYSSWSVCACSHQPSSWRSDGGVHLEDVGRLAHPGAEVIQAQGQQVLQADDAGLQQQLLLGRAHAGQVQQERLVTPLVDVRRVGLDLVGQVLAPRRASPTPQAAGRW